MAAVLIPTALRDETLYLTAGELSRLIRRAPVGSNFALLVRLTVHSAHAKGEETAPVHLPISKADMLRVVRDASGSYSGLSTARLTKRSMSGFMFELRAIQQPDGKAYDYWL